jgi:N-acetylglucosamine kinase-like BadF-type ATPase
MRKRYYIGVDGGGTHTRALLADSSGQILGAGHAPSTNRNHHPRDVVLQNMRQAIAQAMSAAGSGELRCVFLGMCGVSTDSDKRDISSIVREIPEIPAAAKVLVENDTHTALVGGLSGRPGMALIAGTGSACLGVTGDGRSWLCGGWGALADDAGSAPWIGIKAIQAAVRSQDGRLGPTSLQSVVFDFLGLADPRQLIDRVHNRGLEREEIGRLAPHVIAACCAGDAVAAEIVRAAAAELSRMVATVAGRLFGGEAGELILVGGLALSGPPFQPLLIERIQRDTPAVRVREPEMSPVQGAVLEALRADGVAWTEAVLAGVRRARVEGT